MGKFRQIHKDEQEIHLHPEGHITIKSDRVIVIITEDNVKRLYELLKKKFEVQ